MKFLSVSDILNTVVFRNPSNGYSKVALYSSFVKSIMNDLDFAVIKTNVVTKKYKVDKKTNSVKIPNDCRMISAIGYVDDCGGLQPLEYNKKIPLELQFENYGNNCNCNCGCDGKCTEIKVEQKYSETIDLGNGVLREKTVLIYMDSSGNLIKKTKEPYSYISDRKLLYDYKEKEEKVCSIDVRDCGCPKDTQENKEAVKKACECIGTFNLECGTKVCAKSKELGYNINYQGDLIVLPEGYDYDNLVIKYHKNYESESDFIIPEIALEVFMMGFIFYELRQDPKTFQASRLYLSEYQREIRNVYARTNKMSIDTYKKTLGLI